MILLSTYRHGTEDSNSIYHWEV